MGLLSGLGKSLSKGLKSFGKTLGKTGNVFSSAFSFFDSTQGDVEDAWDDYTGKNVAMKNLKESQRQFDIQNALNEKQFAYQKELNDLQMQREDTAYQRKVADMTKAGFNPILATGGSGSPSSLLSAPSLRTAPAPSMPDYSGGVRSALSSIFSLLSMRKDFAVKDKQISLMDAQEDDAIASADSKRADAELKFAEAESTRIRNKYLDDRLLNENAGVRLRNEGQAGRNIYQSTQNAIAENELLISSSTKFAEVESRLRDLDLKKLKYLDIDADLILKADKHLMYQYENNLLDVQTMWANKLANKEFDIKTYEAVAKALTITKLESDLNLYLDAKKHYENLGYSPEVIRQKLDYQFGSWSAQFDRLRDQIASAGRNAREILDRLDIKYHLEPFVFDD